MPNKVYTPQHGSLIGRFDLTGWTREKGDVIRIETRGDAGRGNPDRLRHGGQL